MGKFIQKKSDGNGFTIDWSYLRIKHPDLYEKARQEMNPYTLNRMAIDFLFEIDPEVYEEITKQMINGSKLKEEKW